MTVLTNTGKKISATMTQPPDVEEMGMLPPQVLFAFAERIF